MNVVITPSAAGIPTAGQTYSLDCSVSGTSNPATYQWFDSNGTQLANTSQLQFSPLRVSDAGVYTCRATVEGEVLEGSVTVNINCKYLYTVSYNNRVFTFFASLNMLLCNSQLHSHIVCMLLIHL